MSSHNYVYLYLVTFNRMLMSPIGSIFILISRSLYLFRFLINGTELILITILYLLRNYTYGRLILIGSYTHGKLILIGSFTYSSRILFLFGFLICCIELIHVRILISSLCLFRSPVGVTEPMLIQRYINTYWNLYLFQISRRSLQNL